jgi:transposase
MFINRKEFIMQENPKQMKRHFIQDKIIIGIDPSKKKHQAIIINTFGDPMGNSFSFKHNRYGFHVTLWKRIKERLNTVDPEKIVFAVETSINLWQKLSHYLHEQGFSVVMVRPLATKHERPKMSNSFTKTDPKDSLAIANIARQGYFNFFKVHTDHIQAMHRLSITYDKLNDNIRQTKQRIRSQVELLFPELIDIIDVDTKTANKLLEKYLTPQDFQQLNLFTEEINIRKASRNRSDISLLKALKETAFESIGLPVQNESQVAERLTMNVWLNLLNCLEEQMNVIRKELINLAKQTSYFNIIVSLKGISDISAARFIAETRDLREYRHYKQIEKMTGSDLKLSDSGKYSGYRHISHIGNHRLRAILYKMSEETKNYIPEVRIRYLKRQMKQARYKKNVIAVSSNLLKIMMAMIKENRTYSYCPEKLKELELLENQYKEFKDKKKNKRLKKVG